MAAVAKGFAARVPQTVGGPLTEVMAIAPPGGSIDVARLRAHLAAPPPLDTPTRPRMMAPQLFTELAMTAGRSDLALEALAAMGNSRLADVTWLDRGQLFASVRASQAFDAIRAKIARRAHTALAVFRSVLGDHT